MKEMDSSAYEDREEHLAHADWEESPSEVLEAVDEQLNAFGLEIVVYDTEGDDYAWEIKKR
jgi:hypothetical protein